MLCPAAVSAAAAAVWLLAVLGPGLSLPAEDNSKPGFSLCSYCFYRQTPPQGDSAGPLLRPLCHRLPGGQAFATLSKPTCDTAVYSAFHVSHGWTEREEGGELVEEEDIKGAVPALLRGSGGPSNPVSPLQHWDSTVTTWVQSTIMPQCSSLGGELYILTGVGSLGAAEDGGEECQTKPLWSAMCCAVPEGQSGFSVGLIREAGEGERQVSVKELEEILGVAELFSEGCGGADGETVGITAEELDADLTGENTAANEADSDTTSQDSNEDIKESEALVTGEQVPPEASAEYETVDEQETDTNSTSTLVYILSTTMSILKAPLQPVFSTITQLPGQVTYVLQEDLGVLSALPGDTFSLVHLLTSDLLSWMGSAAELLLGIGETCFFGIYFCTSSMLEALLNSCYTGFTGIGTLAGDTVGIFGDALDNGWWVTKFFGGRLWEQSEGYVGTVMSEMGGQAKAVGGGFGKLVWRSGNGVGNVFRLGGGIIMGVVDMVIGAVRGAFGQESE
uniref:INO80 complex subunit E n=1 Tax=Dicentrarchus labrax TaxID=13489 RepID=A0A8C4DRV1_DICLA